MFPSRRSYWLGIGFLAYVCFGAMQSASSPLVPLAALVALSILLAELWRRTARRESRDPSVEAQALSAVRACYWGAAVWVGARTGAAGRPALDAAANIGLGTASVAGLITMARIAPLGGLLVPRPSTRSLDAAGFAAVLWGIAVAIPATRAFAGSADLLLDPLAIDYATTTAAAGSLMVSIAVAWRLRIQRRLESGVGDRAAGALALSTTAFCVAVPAAAANIAPPDRVLPVAVLAGAAACAWTATTRDPTTVSTALRGVLAVMILGVPTTLLFAISAREAPSRAGAIALIGCCLSVVVGLIAHRVARPLGPEQSRWLGSIHRAMHGALQPEPDAALRAALVALRGTASSADARPELWRTDPPELLTVDVAGYLHIENAEAPQRLYELALGEPERTLRADTLKALEVRRPDVRPLVAWFETHNAFSTTVIVDEDGPIGFILLPRGKRTNPMTLEESRAVRLLADRLSALLAVSSTLARSRQRQLEAERRAHTLQNECNRLEAIVSLGSDRHRAHASQIARPLRQAAYSPGARMGLETAERLGRIGAPVTLEVPAGVHATEWAAVVHLASPRAGGPFVVVDAAQSAVHSPEHWEDASTSPIQLADGGTLVVLDIAALPLGTQDAIARALVERATNGATSKVLPPGLVVTCDGPLEKLVAAGRLAPTLSTFVGNARVALPGLADRVEDIRALVLDKLAAIGVQRRGEPLGIEPVALRLLIEHSWPGNDTELTDVLNRASRVAAGPVVTMADFASIGFATNPRKTAPGPSTPPPSRRRPRASASGSRR